MKGSHNYTCKLKTINVQCTHKNDTDRRTDPHKCMYDKAFFIINGDVRIYVKIRV